MKAGPRAAVGTWLCLEFSVAYVPLLGSAPFSWPPLVGTLLSLFPQPSPFGTEFFHLPEKKGKKKSQVLNFSLGSWDKKPSGVGGLNLTALSLAVRS